MSYGFNNPQGFVPVRSDTNSVLASSLRTLPIKNQYATNIFTGDPVIWAGTYNSAAYGTVGYMISLYDFIAGNNTTGTGLTNENGGGAPILGIFQGVQYAAPNDSTSPNTPIREYWPGGTSTADGRDAVGYFIPANYEYGFSIQANVNAAPTPTIVSSYVRVAFNVPSPAITGVVGGNTATGQSKCTVDLSTNSQSFVPWATAGAPKPNNVYSSFFVEDIDYSQGTSGATVPYGNVIVRLTNFAYPYLYDHA